MAAANGDGSAPRMYDLFLVEDHPTMRRLLKQLLDAEDDLQVVGEAGAAEAALNALDRLEVDLLLVDLSLPGMNGLELIARLRELRPELRCLVVTGHDGAAYRIAAERAGAVGFVGKDDPGEVLKAVRAALVA